jgi:Zn finger protein HypA/HybF involved in hydrogenase expression
MPKKHTQRFKSHCVNVCCKDDLHFNCEISVSMQPEPLRSCCLTETVTPKAWSPRCESCALPEAEVSAKTSLGLLGLL